MGIRSVMGGLLCGRYRLIERLGEGGMSVVWRGHDEVLGRQVAVKLPAPDQADDPGFAARLRQEAQVAARLSHPNIMSVHDYGEAKDPDGTVRPFVVTEMLEGETLRACLSGGRSLPWQRAVTIAAEIACALAAAHARGVVHRDISTGNVMLTPTGAKLLDFGISALAGEADSEPGSRHQLVGTPAYVAPERLTGCEVTPAVDVYAFGVLLYRALRGSLPWAVESTTDLFDAHLWMEPDPLPPLPGMPPQLARLCERCLAKDPSERPSSAELAASLAQVKPAEEMEPAGEAGGTAVLPWRPFVPGVVPVRREQGTVIINRRGRYTLAAMGIAFVLILASGLALSRGDSLPEMQAPVAAGAGSHCRVTYVLTSDTGARFAAAVTVHNDGPAPVDRWQLEFGWPGDQTMVGADAVAWAQQGRTVVVRAAGDQTSLAAGGSHRFALAGEYRALNAMPAEFALGGTRCASVQLAQPVPQAQASQSVQSSRQETNGGKGKNKGKGGGDDDDDEDDD